MGYTDEKGILPPEFAEIGFDEELLPDTPCFIDPPSLFCCTKALQRFVSDYENVPIRSVRSVVKKIRSHIAEREVNPERYKSGEAYWDEVRHTALAKVPKVVSDEDAYNVAAHLIAKHAGRAIDVAAKERDKLVHDLGEVEAGQVWQRIVNAILEIQPESDRIAVHRWSSSQPRHTSEWH
jgi:hypothetical protein